MREKSQNHVAGVLCLAANALPRSDSYLGARYRSLHFSYGNDSSHPRSSWFIAIRSILQPCGCQYELSTWLNQEAFHLTHPAPVALE
jgi:hypothetical protein